MSSLPPIFLDLAIILITAGIITVIFKWLKQPLVLGYIVAGFFIGPYFPWFPAITDDSNIHLWSDIGIVFLMFALGLEFSIKKLKKVGGTGAITALTELLLMFLIGNIVGHILGWPRMDCIFLGCMLSISSTTIIIKSFDDLKLRQQRFTSTVFGVLVVEDLIAVLLLVLLSTISVSAHFDGKELGLSLVKLVFMLIVWFVFGIFFIPTFLRWMRRHMTEETLCIVAVGLCFGMVWLAGALGFSTALGAFVMGAILAETIEADTIHRIITPLKNLFGAVFFVSVGMLVDPKILAEYIVPILVIALTVILLKSASATTGIVLSGKSMKTAIQSGFCFCQIGEFSFIIAGLGLSFKVIRPELYPIIVSVSIVTTFVTPYMIKAGLPFYNFVYPKLPTKFKEALENYSNSAKGAGREISVQRFLRKQLWSILIYGAILGAIYLLSITLLKPLLNAKLPGFWGNLIGLSATLVLMSPFAWAMVVKNVSKERIRKLLKVYQYSQAVVIPVLLLRYFIALLFVGITIGRYANMASGFIVVLAIVIVALVLYSRRAIGFYQHIEKQFVSNFNQRQNQNSFKIPETLEQNFSMERVLVTQYCKYIGKKLSDCCFRQVYGINIVAVERGGDIINLPGRDLQIMPMDKLTVIGGEEEIGRFRMDMEVEPDMLIHDHGDNNINIYRYEVTPTSNLIGVELRHSDFQSKYKAMVIAVEHNGAYKLNPDANTVFQQGDTVWFVSPEEVSLSAFSNG
ncbi:MAG: cation:proton antiporter [Bacteroidales bacterium]|nr:cation:proton antiporter [Bacteroidales bacterium]